ncbi:hypothetical protein V8F33_003260 [Rhypophila sp. PSN 637]
MDPQRKPRSTPQSPVQILSIKVLVFFSDRDIPTAKTWQLQSTYLALIFISSASTSFIDQATEIEFKDQLTFPLANGAGWGDFSLTGDIEGPLLMVAWPDGQGNIISSFRQVFNEDDNPPEVTRSFTSTRIPEATGVNNTFLTYTFLCEGCLAPNLGFEGAGAVQATEMGWTLASRAVRDPGILNGISGFYNSGFGGLRVNIAAVRNLRFNKWAALAEGQAVLVNVGAIAFDETNAAEGSGDVGFGGGGGGGGGSGGFVNHDDDSDSDFD